MFEIFFVVCLRPRSLFSYRQLTILLLCMRCGVVKAKNQRKPQKIVNKENETIFFLYFSFFTYTERHPRVNFMRIPAVDVLFSFYFQFSFWEPTIRVVLSCESRKWRFKYPRPNNEWAKSCKQWMTSLIVRWKLSQLHNMSKNKIDTAILSYLYLS